MTFFVALHLAKLNITMYSMYFDHLLAILFQLTNFYGLFNGFLLFQILNSISFTVFPEKQRVYYCQSELIATSML